MRHHALLHNKSREFKAARPAPCRNIGSGGKREALDASCRNLSPVSWGRHRFCADLVCCTDFLLAPAVVCRPNHQIPRFLVSPSTWVVGGWSSATRLDGCAESKLHFFRSEPRLPPIEPLELAAVVRGCGHLANRDDTLDAYARAALHDSRPLL